MYAGTMWMRTGDANLEEWRRSLERLAASDASGQCGGHGLQEVYAWGFQHSAVQMMASLAGGLDEKLFK